LRAAAFATRVAQAVARLAYGRGLERGHGQGLESASPRLGAAKFQETSPVERIARALIHVGTKDFRARFQQCGREPAPTPFPSTQAMQHKLLLSLSLMTLGAIAFASVSPLHAAASPELVACADDTDPMISINPGNGGSVHPGGTIFVDNWTNTPATLKITLEDGTVLHTATIPAMSIHDYQVPNLPILLGHVVSVSVVAGPTSASADIKIN
jgi:hypothetical protein